MNSEDFFEIGQTDDDLNISMLDTDDLIDVVDIRELDDFRYPAMLISGIQFKDTLRVLKSVRKESYRLFDVWVDLGDDTIPIKQGSLPATLETLLVLRYLGLKVTLYLSADIVETLDLRNPDVLVQYI